MEETTIETINALQKIDPQIIVHEDDSIEVKGVDFNKKNQVLNMLDQILSDKETRSYVATLMVHKELTQTNRPIVLDINRNTTVGEIVDWYHLEKPASKFLNNLSIHEVKDLRGLR